VHSVKFTKRTYTSRPHPSSQNKQGQLVAIKIIDLENTQDDILDLQKEIHIQLSCNSPYIVHLYGSFIQKTELHIVMEYLSGGSIKRFLKEAPLEEDQIAVVLKDVLQALAYLHNEKRVHRDIKADNILIGANGDIKLADFGVAGQLTTTMSKRNTTCGTPYWMA
jgi:serine/threonine-protein kinase 24/25/MST4